MSILLAQGRTPPPRRRSTIHHHAHLIYFPNTIRPSRHLLVFPIILSHPDEGLHLCLFAFSKITFRNLAIFQFTTKDPTTRNMPHYQNFFDSIAQERMLFHERVQGNRILCVLCGPTSGRVLDGCHGRAWERRGVRAVESWYMKSASCAFCMDQLWGWVLDGCSGRAWERRGVRAVESWYRESASCAFCVDQLREWSWTGAMNGHGSGGASGPWKVGTGNMHPVRSVWTRSHSWEEGGYIRPDAATKQG
jgi:hypothetical protein